MNKIFQYTVGTKPDEFGPVSMVLPSPCHVMDANFQNDVLCIWAIVQDPSTKTSTAIIHVIPTGGEVPAKFAYLTTVHHPPFVWHIFIQEL